MSNLHLRYPYLYLTPNCTRCNQQEDTLHLLNCSQAPLNHYQILNQHIIQTTTELKIENINASIITNILLNTNTPNTPSQNILFLIQGTFSQNILNRLQPIFNKNTTNFCLNLSNNLLIWFNSNIWQIRNQFQHDWEVSRNITSKSKRIKFSLPNITSRNPTTSTTTIYNHNIDSFIEKWHNQNFSIHSCFY
jgi:hypothetical protein